MCLDEGLIVFEGDVELCEELHLKLVSLHLFERELDGRADKGSPISGTLDEELVVVDADIVVGHGDPLWVHGNGREAGNPELT